MDDNKELEEEKEEKKKKRFLLIFLLMISAVFVSVGLSMAVFSYLGNGSTTNVIKTGKIVFSYSDANGQGNGINITNAMPISDSVGKTLSNSNEYFDFSVTASTTATDISYEIVVKKENTSTLADDHVKIYLTERQGATEIPTPITGGSTVPTYAALGTTSNANLSGKTIYYGTVNAGEVAYGKNFRLRMWIKENNSDNFDEVNSKEYSVRVNVAALGSN